MDNFIAQVYDITQCIITEHSDIFLIAYYFKMKYFKQLYTSIQFQGFMAKKKNQDESLDVRDAGCIQ